MEKQSVTLTDNTANPAPIGLLAFGMTTMLLNLHNAGLFGLSAMIVAMGMFYGGLAQLFVGIMEWKKNNTFGATAFTSYGCFWLVLCAMWILPKIQSGGAPIVAAADVDSKVAFLAMWGILTGCLFFGTLKMSRALQFVFGSLTILFFLLAIGDKLENETIIRIAGIEGIVCGASAFYTAIAQILNEVYGRTVLPLGAVKKAPVSSDVVHVALPASAKA